MRARPIRRRVGRFLGGDDDGGSTAGDPPHLGVIGVDRHHVGRSIGSALDLPVIGLFPGQQQGQDQAFAAGAGRSAAAVQEVLVVARRVVVDDEFHLVDVDSPGSDIGRHQDGATTAGEVGQGALALRLAAVAVNRPSLDAPLTQLLGEPVGAMFGAHEEQTAAVARGDPGGHLHLLLLLDREGPMFHLGRSLDWGGMNRRIRQMRGGQRLDTAVESGREEQSLAVGRDRLDDACDRREESQVGHVIGLVQDQDFDPAQ